MFSKEAMPKAYTSSTGKTHNDERHDAHTLIEALHAFPDACLLVDESGNIVEVNDQAVEAFGRTRTAFRKLSLWSLVNREFHSRVKETLRQCRSGCTPDQYEVEVLTKEGEEKTAILHFAHFPYDGSPTCLIVARDISESKQQELELLRFSNVSHYTVNPVEITDPKGNIVYVNPAFEKASGYAKEEVLGKNPNIFGSGKHTKTFWQKMWKTINSGKVWVGEVENRRRDGEPYYTQLLISPIIDSEGIIVGYFGVHRDISEQKQLQQQLIHAQKMESIGLLAAGIAHEVGNPLTSISSIVQVIQRTTSDEFTQEKLELIKSQITRISRIIRDLVDFSRRSSYEVQMTDINKSIREAVEIVRVGKKAKSIFFQVDLDDKLPLLPLVPDQIQQVFINILINAVDAIHSDLQLPTRNKSKKPEVAVCSRVEDEQIVITLEDTGKGIPEDALPKIFEPFFTTKKVGEGTGLGLWVSYGLIKSFQGTINVASTEGEGTTFTITLPLQSTVE